MKLKLIAAAAVLAASGAANAAIDIGTDGAGDMFFSIWDANSSYTLDLNIQQNAFLTSVAATGSYDFRTALTGDALFNQFISTADRSSLNWNVLAVETQGAKTVLQTYSSALPESGITADNGRPMAQNGIQAWVGYVNTDGLGTTANSAIFANTSRAYAGHLGCDNFDYQNFNTCGTLANSSAATGLGLVSQSIAASGQAASVLTPVADSGDAVKVYLDSNYNLNMVAAVPEPETYAMLLAGLGLMGAVARRRNKKA